MITKRHVGGVPSIVLVAAWLGAVARLAAAGPIDDCTNSRDPALRIAGCSAVIASPAAPADKARAFRYRGEARLAAGANRDALADFTDALALGKDAASYAGRGEAHLRQGNGAGAIADLTEAIGLAPRDAHYRNLRGHAHLVAGKPKLVFEDFSEAHRLDPRNPSALNNRGLAHARLGNSAAAIADYSAALTLNPAYAIALLNRGQAHEAAGDDKAAIADYSRAISIDTTLLGASEGLKRLKSAAPGAAEADRIVAEGRTLAAKNCAWCHATEDVGASPNPKAPPFRSMAARHAGLGLRDPLARGIAAPHEEMPDFKLEGADVDKLVAYINSLGRKAGR